MEYAGAAVSREDIPVLIASEKAPFFLLPNDIVTLTCGAGQFTCCLRNHVFDGVQVPCDKPSVRSVLSNLISAKVAHLFNFGDIINARVFQSLSHFLLKGLSLSAHDSECPVNGDHAVLRMKENLQWGTSSAEQIALRQTGFTLLHYAV